MKPEDDAKEHAVKLPFLKRYQNLILIFNLLLLGLIVFLLLVYRSPHKKIAPLVEGSQKTKARIKELEQLLMRSPKDIKSAVELSRLYQDVGEFPWSYNALKVAEGGDNHDPQWRFILGLAYLELGKNIDAKRVLKKTKEQCHSAKCPPNLVFQLDLFTHLVDRFIEKNIDARKHYGAAEKVLKELLKPVKADPEKMRPKAPAQHEPQHTPRKPSG